jgi:transcriptional repressor NrdR
MVCIYCGNNTQVINSRLHKKLNRVWRRRQCATCQSVFTTTERSDEGHSFMVLGKKNDTLVPFSRDKLFISLHKSCAHRKDAITDTTALTETIISKLFFGEDHQAVLSPGTIKQTIVEVLDHFDKLAMVHYLAYHEG